jgi:hypothetical protein
MLITTIRTITPGGTRAVIAESLPLKHQLVFLNRSRKKTSEAAHLGPSPVGRSVQVFRHGQLSRQNAAE